MEYTEILAARRTLLNEVCRLPPHKALKLCFKNGNDWGLLATLATRTDLTPRVFEELLWHGSPSLHVALCSNEAFPLRLLRRLADIPNGKPSGAVDDLALEAHDIRRVARAALRRRLARKKAKRK